jgi:hypothetical protein
VESPIATSTQATNYLYRWTIPPLTNITNANYDSSIINISFNLGFNGGTLSVKGQTICGITGVAKSISFLPSKALDLVSSTGFLNFCIGSSADFIVVSPVSSPTLPIIGYRWTKPAFTSIISANSDSSFVTLQFNTGYKGGALKVQSTTSCGLLGTPVSKTLTHIGCALGQRGSNEILADDQCSISPNPNNGTFNLKIEAAIKNNKPVNIQIIDMTGRVVLTQRGVNNSGIINENINGPNLKNGLYMINYIIGDTRKSIKMIVQK